MCAALRGIDAICRQMCHSFDYLPPPPSHTHTHTHSSRPVLLVTPSPMEHLEGSCRDKRMPRPQEDQLNLDGVPQLYRGHLERSYAPSPTTPPLTSVWRMLVSRLARASLGACSGPSPCEPLLGMPGCLGRPSRSPSPNTLLTLWQRPWQLCTPT